MIHGKTVLAVIPARGGSKGVPGKNIRTLGGKPLLAYSILSALQSTLIDELLVSTDDDAIAGVARTYGCAVDMRPANLATDSASIVDTFKYLLDKYAAAGKRPDILVMLQPTTPFRTAQDIDAALTMLVHENADAVVSVCEAPNKVNPHWVRKIEDGNLVPYLEEDKANPHVMRQQLPKVYWRNGQIYAFLADTLETYGDLYGKTCKPYVMPRGNHVNIDDETDFLLAEVLVERGLVEVPK